MRFHKVPLSWEEYRQWRAKWNKYVDMKAINKLTYKKFLGLTKPLERGCKKFRESKGIKDKSIDERNGGLFGIYKDHNGIKGRWHNG